MDMRISNHGGRWLATHASNGAIMGSGKSREDAADNAVRNVLGAYERQMGKPHELLAAAHELLAALRFLGDGPELPPGLKLYEQAQAAIAKAKGQPS